MAFQGGGTTLISKDSEIVGDIKFTGDLEIQGIVRGNIMAKDQSKATVRVVEGGQIEGEIHAPHVIVNGLVKGDIHSAEHIELAAKAQIQGNVHYQLIEMVKGAQVNGSLLYAAAKSVATPINKAVAQNAVEVD
ncbi:polymer-forming cytoskeletal protein [Dasania sp. GY-MA-18]|uniref:Polymer-forming cytoskeletal protein n=1 Tax=Dasania phycosphaerae TaxID=2950436 RepID=A0A9J6RS22_9GAMM|nr:MULTISPECIES: polymer-forming cytoskeletal protein [Dasania]MCR8924398.1 polymer-forming cytoskeletal protein [Dasania sp. GY-MA-18]MCZ0867073.1 polymer-forming cytoskeletal protein [Dasania phycosphaerae]MCZ0870525.1 polymer-forming cytoskeletal protein [Dasania phycosphaerae]